MSISVEDLEASFSLATNAIHMDDRYAGVDVAPAMHPSTTFRYPYNPNDLKPQQDLSVSRYSWSAPEQETLQMRLGTQMKANGVFAWSQKTEMVYARLARPTGSRFEHVLTSILNGESLVYSTGLSAIHAYLVRLTPKKVAISGGYHGTHSVLELHHRLTGTTKVTLDEIDQLESGDVIHLETPVNPTGEARNIAAYAKIAQEKGLYLVVDSTFGPPALQDPFLWGADVVIHSGTKYIGGHSDIMCGIISVSPSRNDLFKGLWEDRCALGNILGGFESWLGLRSLRTLDLRCRQQSKSCASLVKWLSEQLQDSTPNLVNATVEGMTHASLQVEDSEWLEKQMPHGFGPVFGLIMKTESFARRLPSKLRVFQHATSLGGVESLIEWRKMSDHLEEGNILRVSVGVETFEDLQRDIINGLQSLVEEISETD